MICITLIVIIGSYDPLKINIKTNNTSYCFNVYSFYFFVRSNVYILWICVVIVSDVENCCGILCEIEKKTRLSSTKPKK